MADQHRLDVTNISEELDLFTCLHTLNSSFDRILTALNLLNARLLLPAESVQAKSQSIETLRAALNLELKEKLGEINLGNFDTFSANVNRPETQSIGECKPLT